ncbi:hypothetical protein BGZ63DRAFT_452925 [Mariannaea sp. PMI_226]|nr:hypothetical protein BGZ63DRAFT_452925 [Mariannaea sp. PMI_226]
MLRGQLSERLSRHEEMNIMQMYLQRRLFMKAPRTLSQGAQQSSTTLRLGSRHSQETKCPSWARSAKAPRPLLAMGRFVNVRLILRSTFFGHGDPMATSILPFYPWKCMFIVIFYLLIIGPDRQARPVIVRTMKRSRICNE